MKDNEGFDILHNGLIRSSRDKRNVALAAAQYAKSKDRGDIIEIIDRSTGQKMLVLEDGRIS